MATTFVEYTGDGNATKQFTFPSYQESDVKVRVDGVLKTTSTHYNITNYTTTGGGNVVFTSGNIPSSPANIRIYRDTNVDTAKATFTAGSSVKAADLNNNTTQLLYRAQEEQIPNLIHSYDIDDDAIETSKIKASAVTNAKIADDSVTGAKLSNNLDIPDGNKIRFGDSADLEIFHDGTHSRIVDTKANGVLYIDGSGTAIRKADGSETIAGFTADGPVDLYHNGVKKFETSSAGVSVTGNIVVSGTVDGRDVSTDGSKLDGIEAGATANQTNAEIRAAVEAATDSNVFTDADHSKLNGIEAGATADQTASEIKTLIASSPLDSSHLAANSVTTSEIADAELTTLAGMQSATASKLASSTALTADIADLNQIDGMQKATTVTNDDTKFPTSGAIVDYVAAQLEPFGGFEAIANESSFPNTQPASGVVISIADAGGMAVSGSGTASGATVSGTTVNITGIASNFNGTTVDAGVRFLVVSTGSGQNYTYHKATLKEDDLLNLSGDINDFSERYRVGSSNPTTGLDNGDLFFNTGSGKLLVYNGTNSAWEETQTVGNFFINTISSSSSTGGGSATPNGTAYRFTLSNAGASAQQHLVSVDGVIQKPNSGTSQPSEGFAIDGGDIIFGSAPVNNASLFVITIGASVSIGTPSNNTVTTAILQNGSVTTAKIVDDAVTMAKIANGAVGTNQIASNAVTTAKIANDAVTGVKIASEIDNSHITATANIAGSKLADNSISLAKLEHGTSSNNGKFLRANNGADPTFETISNQTLQFPSGATGVSCSTENEIQINSSNYKVVFDTDTSNIHEISFAGPSSLSKTSAYTLPEDGSNGQFLKTNGSGVLSFATVTTDLVGDTSPQLGADLDTNGSNINFADSNKAVFGTNNDLQLYHDGSNSYIKQVSSATGDLLIFSDGHDIEFITQSGGHSAKMIPSGAVELYHNNNKKFETTSAGAQVTGTFNHLAGSYTNNSGGSVKVGHDSGKFTAGASDDLQMYHDGANTYIKNFTNNLHIGAFSTGNNSGMAFYSNNANRMYLNPDGHLRPNANNTHDLGTSSYRWRNVYTNDLHLSNEGHTNSVDGTWGDWTIQEGESDLFLKNNRSGKKYKFNLTEVS